MKFREMHNASCSNKFLNILERKEPQSIRLSVQSSVLLNWFYLSKGETN